MTLWTIARALFGIVVIVTTLAVALLIACEDDAV